MTPKQKNETRYAQGRANLLILLLLTAVNILLTFLNSSVSFPFSATLPIIFYAFGSAFAEESGSTGYLIAGLLLALVVLAGYLIMWILAKKRPAALLAATVFFGVDTLALGWLALSINALGDFVIDFLFHGLVLYLLIVGVKAGVALRRAPSQEEPSADGSAPQPAEVRRVSRSTDPEPEAAVCEPAARTASFDEPSAPTADKVSAEDLPEDLPEDAEEETFTDESFEAEEDNE